jgi:diguanylate cyclase (GGDEF)-like protein
MHQCYIFIYEEPSKNNIKRKFEQPDKARMILGYNNGVQMEPCIIDTINMLPSSVLLTQERNELIFYPLFSGENHFGYIVWDMNAINEYVFETFREQISSTLNMQMMFRERIKAEQQLNSAVKDLEKMNSELKSIYLIDELTGLMNRRGFYLNGGNMFKSAMVTGGRLILCFIDMDGLKTINDTYGHSEGDTAIKAVAGILSKSFGKEDIIARLGGDEFTAIIPNRSTESEMTSIKERIKHNFDIYNLYSQKPYNLSISIGFSPFLPGRRLTFEELILEADQRLYEQKKKRTLHKIIDLH